MAGFSFRVEYKHVQFKMHDFTKHDMTKYIKEYLEGSDKFRTAAALDNRCLDLIPAISEKANGVWLWVFLVVRNILRDIRDGEPFQNWKNRLESYPQELEAYFRKIMNRIDPFYRQQGAEIFLLALATRDSKIPMIGLSILYDEDKSWCGISHEGRLLTGAELEQMYTVWHSRLQNRCRDLMRLSRDRRFSRLCDEYEVNFLHRTVKDFLQQHYTNELRALVSTGFSEPICLARSTLALIEQNNLYFSSNLNDRLTSQIDLLFRYLRDAQGIKEKERQAPSLHSKGKVLLRQQDVILDGSDINRWSHHLSWAETLFGKVIDFTFVTIRFRLQRCSLDRLQVQSHWLCKQSYRQYSRKQKHYYGRVITKGPGVWPCEYYSSSNRPCKLAVMYMENVIRPPRRFQFWKTPLLKPELVVGLHELGIGPNIQLSPHQTAWVLFLSECVYRWGDWSLTQRAEGLDAIRIFLRRGAKMNVVVEGRRISQLLPSLVDPHAMLSSPPERSGGASA